MSDRAAATTIDVVIVAYDSRDSVLEALRSLQAEDGPPVCVHVVDNASRDGTAAAVRSCFADARGVARGFTSTHLVENPANLGFAAACNQGWRSGSEPLVLFLNPDAQLRPGALEALARVFAEGPRVGIAGPRTLNADGSVQVSAGPDLSPLRELEQRRLVRGVARRDPTALAAAEALHAHARDVDWVSGACLMARRSCLEAVGGFDEGFFLYEEDADLCRRAREAGWTVAFTPDAVAVHGLGRSMARSPRRARLEYHRSHLRYYDKHLGIGSRLALRAWLISRESARWLAGLLRGEEGRPVRAEALAVLRLVAGRRAIHKY
ncbi:MAG TPA: glycosyltransferase family 2 protein [Vicinamibacteria bacterium]|nr:glycosyltransferase family 2 protein [Vicinamibacteria bacterium]